MVALGSVRARRPVLPAPLAPVAVLLGVAAMFVGLLAVGRLGLGLRASLLVSELLLVLPGLALLALSGAHLPEALGLRALDRRTAVLSLAAGITLWGASLGLFELQYVLWAPPEGYLEAFRRLHAALRPANPAEALLSLAAIALAPAVCEEALFRGIVLPSLRTALGAVLALPLQALLFGLIHLDFTTPGPPVLYRVPFAVAVGLGLGALRLRTGSLTAPALSHAVLNAITFLAVPLVDDPTQGVPDPSPLLGLSLLGAGTGATLLVFRALPRVDSPVPPA